jgi:hypothetical protein
MEKKVKKLKKKNGKENRKNIWKIKEKSLYPNVS